MNLPTLRAPIGGVLSCNRVQHWSWLTTVRDVTPPPEPGYATTIVVTRFIILRKVRNIRIMAVTPWTLALIPKAIAPHYTNYTFLN